MTCHISPTKHTLQPGYSYLSSYRQAFQHIPSADQRAIASHNGRGSDARRRTFSLQTQRTSTPTEARKDNSLLQALSDKYFARPTPRPSMVKLEGEPQHKTPPSRKAEQATSSQRRVPEVNPRLAPCQVNSRDDSTRTHGQHRKNQLSMSSDRGKSPVMESDVDSYASCPSTPDAGSLFSSRATTPEDDDDEVDLTPETMLARKKREIVDSNMKLFTQLCYWWFARALGLVECAGGKRKRTDQPSENNLGGSNSNQNPPPGGTQKRQFSDDNRSGGLAPDGGDDEDDDSGGNRAAGKKRAKRDLDEGLKFACPFFKHDSAKYGTQRTCCGPGWENVHRVKEHLYRRHRAPKFVCLRCNEAFRTEDLYRTHQRAASPCSLQDPCAPDGFDEAKEKQLRARQKNNRPTTERQKWEDVYSILFPDDLVPSPYHDKAESKADNRYASDQLAWVEQYVHREVLPMVRHEMEREVAAELDAVGEKMRKRTMDLAQGMAVRMFQACCAQGFRQLPRQSSTPPPPGSPANPESGSTTPEPHTLMLPVEQLGESAPEYDADPLDGVALMENGGYSLDKEGMDFLDQFFDDSTGAVNSGFTLPYGNWTTSTV